MGGQDMRPQKEAKYQLNLVNAASRGHGFMGKADISTLDATLVT